MTMGDKSKIEWTEATWNPVVGCAKVSEGCRNCYAMKVAHRLAGMGQERYKGLTVKRSSGVEWNGTVRAVPEALEIPRRWTRPRKIFVNSMSDLFHPDVPYWFIDQVFAVMALAKQHTFQILTKRPERMLEYMTSYTGNIERRMMMQARIVDITGNILKNAPTWSLPNVWLGVSVENQATADERIPLLLQTPAAVRWLSMEPLLGPVDIETYLTDLPEDEDGAPYLGGIDWVVVGGESGPKARPMHPNWALSIQEQCQDAGVPFFFKQWGEWAPRVYENHSFQSKEICLSDDGTVLDEMKGSSVRMVKLGKTISGRKLFGMEWNGMPEVKS